MRRGTGCRSRQLANVSRHSAGTRRPSHQSRRWSRSRRMARGSGPCRACSREGTKSGRCGGDEVTGDGWCVPRLFPVPRLPRFLLDTFELAFGEGVPVADVVVLLGFAWCGAAPECTEPHALTVRIETVTATISFMRLLIPGIG